VWHRNWATVRVDFLFPYIMHDRIRGGLLFNLRHNPEQSFVGVRHLILKSYLKAALEHFSQRPNYARANIEAVEDFFKGSFTKTDPSVWTGGLELADIDAICRSLKRKLPREPKILLNLPAHFSQKASVRAAFAKHFDRIQWEELDVPVSTRKPDLTDNYHDYLLIHIPRFLRKCMTPHRRGDLIISSVSSPDLLNILAAKHTLLLDSSLQGYVARNRVHRGFLEFLKTVMKGLKAVTIELPSALKHSEALKKAQTDYL